MSQAKPKSDYGFDAPTTVALFFALSSALALLGILELRQTITLPIPLLDSEAFLTAGAAKRLTTGTAYGIDLWQTEDQSGNDPTVTRANATFHPRKKAPRSRKALLDFNAVAKPKGL